MFVNAPPYQSLELAELYLKFSQTQHLITSIFLINRNYFSSLAFGMPFKRHRLHRSVSSIISHKKNLASTRFNKSLRIISWESLLFHIAIATQESLKWKTMTFLLRWLWNSLLMFSPEMSSSKSSWLITITMRGSSRAKNYLSVPIGKVPRFCLGRRRLIAPMSIKSEIVSKLPASMSSTCQL